MKKSIFLVIIAGFLAGIVSGLFGAGGGMILVPFMTLILKEEEVSSRATTIMCIFFMVLTSRTLVLKDARTVVAGPKKELFINTTGNSGMATGGTGDVLAGIIGGIIGSKLLIKLDKNILKILFIIFLIYASIKMII